MGKKRRRDFVTGQAGRDIFNGEMRRERGSHHNFLKLCATFTKRRGMCGEEVVKFGE